MDKPTTEAEKTTGTTGGEKLAAALAAEKGKVQP